MPRKRYSAEEIIHKLREAEVLLGLGLSVQEAAKELARKKAAQQQNKRQEADQRRKAEQEKKRKAEAEKKRLAEERRKRREAERKRRLARKKQREKERQAQKFDSGRISALLNKIPDAAAPQGGSADPNARPDAPRLRSGPKRGGERQPALRIRPGRSGGQNRHGGREHGHHRKRLHRPCRIEPGPQGESALRRRRA